MQKSLEQIQQENRKFILEAIHGCSYEEALEKELGVGCKVKIKRFMSTQDFNEEIFVIDNYCEFSDENLFRTIGSSHHNEITEIIGKPLTLSRVLLAISRNGYYDDICFNIHGYSYDLYETLEFDLEGVSFNLTKETLEEQSEETQRGLNKFFND
jgi:hypothetical protein